MSADVTVSYFKSLESVRERTSLLLKYPEHLQSFNLDLSKLDQVVDKVLELIKRDYSSPTDIPMHSRWRHFDVGGIKRIHYLLENDWKNVDKIEKVRMLVDLFVVSVLLDAGAGDAWKYKASNSKYSFADATYNRSEGLAVASLDWFLSGGFSSNHGHLCDAKGLESVTPSALSAIFQVSDSNPLVGVEGRCELLIRLGTVCKANPKYFFRNGSYRPGNLVDFIIENSTEANGVKTVDINVLWEVVIYGFNGIWPPTRTKFNGDSLGDVWPSQALSIIAQKHSNEPQFNVPPETKNLICFHKLSQWLSYSLMEPLSLAGIEFKNVEKMTGLAEYRNGGLFVDFKVLQLKPEVLSQFHGKIPTFQVYDDTIVEWRALTVALLDLVGEQVRSILKISVSDLPLVKVLEAGTWKAGREIAASLRPDTKGPPIKIISDGTVF